MLEVSYVDNATVLDMLVEMVADEIKAYCNIDAVPAGQENTQAQMVAARFNARHGVGLTGASYSGIREDYRDAWTPDIYACLNRHRRVKML